MKKTKSVYLTIKHVFDDILRGEFVRDGFDGFVEHMRTNPDIFEVLDMELNSAFIEYFSEQNYPSYDAEQLSHDTLNGENLIKSRSKEYRGLVNDVFSWLEINTRYFESNFVSAVCDYTYSSAHRLEKSAKVAVVLGQISTNAPYIPISQLAKMFIHTRPEGYFKDIDLSDKKLAQLQSILGDRLLKENSHNLTITGRLFANDLSL